MSFVPLKGFTNYYEIKRNAKKKEKDGCKTIKKCFEIFATLITNLMVWFKVLVSCVYLERKGMGKYEQACSW